MTSSFPLPNTDLLPVPVDDGAADHLLNSTFPSSISLPSTSDHSVSVAELSSKAVVILFCYPRTGAPGEVIPDEWNQIPGARGCTPQNCAYRDSFQKFTQFKATVFGFSTQDTAYQKEVKDRLHLPYELLSDSTLNLTMMLQLPTITWKGATLTKRLTMAIKEGKVVKVWYPVFPPDKDAENVLNWLQTCK